MLFIFSTPELIRNLWQLNAAVFLHWYLIRAVPLTPLRGFLKYRAQFLSEQRIVKMPSELFTSNSRNLDHSLK
jgi:hypothetical protein